MGALLSIDPSTGEEIARYEEQNLSAIEASLMGLAKVQRKWQSLPLEERRTRLIALGSHLKLHQRKFAGLISQEMGKLVEEAEGEVAKCSDAAQFFGENLDSFLSPQQQKSYPLPHSIEFRPLGVVLAIMPWNFPFWQALRAIIPALAGGNAILLKHAGNVSGCSLALARAVEESMHLRLVEPCLLKGSKVLPLLEHSLIRGVSFTGSTEIGRVVAASAGRALKKSVLELGGSDPYFIFEDAELSQAAQAAAKSRLLNAGQSCISAKRFFVAEKVLDEFLALFVNEITNAPLAPLALADSVEKLKVQRGNLLKAGARIALDLPAKESRGFFSGKTVVVHESLQNPLHGEETFGPLAQVFPFRSEAQAIEVAQQSPFGLGAAFFSKDIDRMKLHASRMEAGICFINDYVRSDARLPFGGVKDSGWGKELGAFGLWEFAPPRPVVWQA